MQTPESASPLLAVIPVTDTVILRVKAWPLQQSSPSNSFQLPGLDLPRKTGEIRCGVLRALCTAPGEWLVTSPTVEWSVRGNGLLPELQRHGLCAIEMSDGMLVLEIYGRATCTVLSKGCGVDFEIGNFQPQTCASTRLAQIPVLIERTEAELRFRLYVGRSYASYLCAWLADAAQDSQSPA